jgi:hypothetical protein
MAVGRVVANVRHHAINAGFEFPHLDCWFKNPVGVYVAKVLMFDMVFRIFFAYYQMDGRKELEESQGMDGVIFRLNADRGSFLDITVDDIPSVSHVVDR